MTIATTLTLEQLQEKHAAIQSRLSTIPSLLLHNRTALNEQTEKLRTLELEQTLADVTKDERQTHHLGLDIKSLKASILKHRSQADTLLSEQSNLQMLLRAVQTQLNGRAMQRDAAVRTLQAQHLDDTIPDTAREALAELIYYASIKHGLSASQIVLTGLIEQYLEQGGDKRLTKLVEHLSTTRKAKATQHIIEKEAA